MPKFPAVEWQVEQMRLTAFPTSGDIVDLPSWWKAVVGADPEEIAQSPKKHTGSIEGRYGDGKLMLKVEPGRLDWLLGPTDAGVQDALRDGDIPSVGAAEDVAGSFSTVVEKFLALDDLPVVGRIAFGATLLHEESSRDTAYERIADYVPVQLPQGCTDFLFQVNRPTQSSSGVDGLMVNRLTKWNVASLKVQNIAGMIAISSQFYFRVELDMNTSPSFKAEIPKHKLKDVYQELLRSGMAIAAGGLPTL